MQNARTSCKHYNKCLQKEILAQQRIDTDIFFSCSGCIMFEALLSPCPFCGGTAKINKSTKCGGHGEYYNVKYVECTSCGATTRQYACDGYYGMTMTDEELADKWNRRV